MNFADADELVALGAFAGAQVLVVCLSVVIANAYRERPLLVHAAATMMGVLMLQLQVGAKASLAQGAALLLLALSGLNLRELMNHAGALRQPRRWLVGVCVFVLPALALGAGLAGLPLLAPGLAAWSGAVAVVMLRAWPQSQPWAGWLLAGLLAQGGAMVLLVWHGAGREAPQVLPGAALLTFWSGTVYLATVWRSRMFSETRVRVDARNTIDPLTGLSTPLVFGERVQAARSLMRRYGHPSVLLLVHIDNLQRIAAEYGPEAAESAVLVAANRIRQSMTDGDVAARLSHSRIAVLAEGASVPEGTSNLASRILVAGLKEPLAMAPGEFLQFRVVLAGIPMADIAPKALLQRLQARMDEQLQAPSERRIHVLPAEEMPA